jgi:hypothetical protein
MISRRIPATRYVSVRKEEKEPQVNLIHKGIAEFAKSHPEVSYEKMAVSLGVTPARVAQICRKAGIIRGIKITPDAVAALLATKEGK